MSGGSFPDLDASQVQRQPADYWVKEARDTRSTLSATMCALYAGINSYYLDDATDENPFDATEELELFDRWVEGFEIAERVAARDREAELAEIERPVPEHIQSAWWNDD